MATGRKGFSRSRISTRSSKAEQLEREQEQLQQATFTETRASSPVRKNGGVEAEDGCCCCSWSTPKAKRNRIPEIETCPPAPKKQRVAGDGGNCPLRRSFIPFFTPPELTEFFLRASPFQKCPQFEA